MLNQTLQTNTVIQTGYDISFADIVKVAHDAIIAIDESHNIIYFNQGAERIFGYNTLEIIGKPLTLLLPPTAVKIHGEHVRNFQDASETVNLGAQRELSGSGSHKDGTIFPISASIAKTIGQDGRTVFTAILRDATQSKRAEEKLRNLSRKDEAALQIAKMAYWEFELSTGQFTFNNQYYALHGTTAVQAGGYLMSAEKFASKYVPPEHAYQVAEIIQQAAKTSDPNWQYDTETRILKLDGEPIDIHLWFRIEKNAQGQTTRLFGVVQDISVRKQVEVALQSSEARYHVLFEQSAFGVVLMDHETGRTIEANTIASRQLGHTREEFAALSISDYEAEETSAETEKHIRLVIQSGSRDFETRQRTKSGQIRNVHVWATTTQIQGRFFYYAIFQDVTASKRSAAELTAANQELLFQNEEKGKRAAELVIANQELLFQNEEKEKRAAELVIANQELLFQNEEKEKRAAELAVANQELLFQNEEKEKRAAELVIANQELHFQNEEKEKRAAELVIANQELHFQNEEKEKRAAELVIANQELLFQNEEKEKRAAELILANAENIHSLKNVQALHKIDIAINSSLDLKLVLNVLLEQAIVQLDMDAASVLLLNPRTQILTYAAGRGFRSRAIEKTHLQVGEEFSSQLLLERQMVYLCDPCQSHDFARAALLAGEGFVEYFAVQLFAKGRKVGMLEVFQRAPREIDDEWHSFLETLAGQAAVAIDSAQLFQDLQHSNTNLISAYNATIEGWSRALDLRDKETEGHTQRVAEMTERLALAAGFSEAELAHIRRGALLHDIGKLGVPDAILLKPEKLSADEWDIMRLHPNYALEMLSPIAYLHPALDIPYCHHEKWDGSGYPRGLKGEQIPLSARLFAFVDVWDALISNRSYSRGWPRDKIIEHFKSQSGTHFDPGLLELFFKVLNQDIPALN
jgi:PAS domain S-box-containing protein